jgi:hypothetical protein
MSEVGRAMNAKLACTSLLVLVGLLSYGIPMLEAG